MTTEIINLSIAAGVLALVVIAMYLDTHSRRLNKLRTELEALKREIKEAKKTADKAEIMAVSSHSAVNNFSKFLDINVKPLVKYCNEINEKVGRLTKDVGLLQRKVGKGNGR